MDEDGVGGDVAPLPRFFGIEVYRDGNEIILLIGRWRIMWFNPRFRENWQLAWINNEGAWQLELGPAGIAYMRSDD